MDKIKARRLLLKIQTFLEPEAQQELSRLEKDLIKSYILQLYEAVQDEETHKHEAPVRTNDVYHAPKVEAYKPEVPVPPVKEFVPEPPPVFVPEIKVQKPVEIPVEIKHPEPEIKTPEPEFVYTPPKQEAKVFQVPVEEPVKEVVKERMFTPPPAIHIKDEGIDEALLQLFEPVKNLDVADRFSHVPISSIEGAMGLNERIFTLKELFGSDRDLFDATCTRLNELHSFAEARQLLLHGPAKQFKWSDPERIKMAEQFIRIVSRRYPKADH